MDLYSRIIGVDLGDKKSHFAVMTSESEDIIEESTLKAFPSRGQF